jgi:hypothetical protein
VQDFKEHFQKKIEEIKNSAKPEPTPVTPTVPKQLPTDSLYVHIKNEAKGPFTLGCVNTKA